MTEAAFLAQVRQVHVRDGGHVDAQSHVRSIISDKDGTFIMLMFSSSEPVVSHLAPIHTNSKKQQPPSKQQKNIDSKKEHAVGAGRARTGRSLTCWCAAASAAEHKQILDPSVCLITFDSANRYTGVDRLSSGTLTKVCLQVFRQTWFWQMCISLSLTAS